MASSREELLAQQYLQQLSIDDYQVFESPSSESEFEGSMRYHPSFAYEPARYTEEPQSSLDTLNGPVPFFQDHPQQPVSNKDDGQETQTAAPGLGKSKKLYPWMSGGFRRFPYLALLPLLLSIACTGAAITIVLSSDGQPVDGQWSGKMQPGVLLAYTSTFANTFLGVAFAEASVICFWSRAVKGKMPVINLHYYWAGSTGVVGACKALGGKRAMRVSLVCLLVALTSLLRGPLMQRASFVRTVNVLDAGTIDLAIMPNVSSDWAGHVSDTRESGYSGVDFNSGFASVAREYQAKTPIKIPGASRCENCSLSAPAFGFNAVNCTTTSLMYNLTLEYAKNGTVLNKDVNATIFRTGIDFGSYLYQYGDTADKYQNGLLVKVIYKKSSSCRFAGLTNSHQCLLVPSSMRYNIFLDRGNVSFQSGNWTDDERIDDFFWPLNMPSHSTLFPLHSLGNLLFSSSSIVIYDGLVLFPQNTGIMPVLYKKDNEEQVDPPDPTGTLGGYSNCASSYFDPMDDIINSFREIAFRMSIRAAMERNEAPEVRNGTKEPFMQRNVTYTSARQEAQYAADRAALGVAVVVSLLGPVATLVLFWGWWNLGRSFSLSPLEVVNAFVCERAGVDGQQKDPRGHWNGSGRGAEGSETVGNGSKEGVQVTLKERQRMVDIFKGCSSNASAGQLVKYIHMEEVRGTANTAEPMIQYGVVEGSGRLGFSVLDPTLIGQDVVREPRRGELL